MADTTDSFRSSQVQLVKHQRLLHKDLDESHETGSAARTLNLGPIWINLLYHTKSMRKAHKSTKIVYI